MFHLRQKTLQLHFAGIERFTLVRLFPPKRIYRVGWLDAIIPWIMLVTFCPSP